MPSAVTETQLQQAVLQSVQDDTYPDSEAVISSSLPSSALPGLLARFKQAREELKVEIKEVSKDTAPDIDGWIAQAKQLHNDIEKSRATARHILDQSQEGVPAQEQVHDASNKVDLLKGELTFNETLAGTLGHVRRIREQLNLVQDAALGDQFIKAIELLAVALHEIGHLRGFESTRGAGALRHRAVGLRSAIIEALNECWDVLIVCNRSEQCIGIKSEVQRSSLITFEDVILGMGKLGILKDKIDILCKSLNEIFLVPRLVFDSYHTLAHIKVDDDTVRVSGRLADSTIRNTFDDIQQVMEYLTTHLPLRIVELLSDILMPGLTSRLVSIWLTDAVPSTLEGTTEYHEVQALVQNFVECIGPFGKSGENHLTEWVERAPQIWLTKRKETSLDGVRAILSNGLGTTKAVEREETQAVSRDDGVFKHNGGEDGWDAKWSDEEEEKTDQGSRDENVGEEDVSAWGLDDDTDARPESSTPAEAAATDDDDDDDVDQAWGWGDDVDTTPDHPPLVATKQRSAPKSNGANTELGNKVRHITLKETYTITAVPEAILDIVTQIVSDAKSLAHPSQQQSPVAPAATGLFTLPTLVL
ncbi:MAG: ribosome biogenesis protein ytm1, partial [Candelina submexicana]